MNQNQSFFFVFIGIALGLVLAPVAYPIAFDYLNPPKTTSAVCSTNYSQTIQNSISRVSTQSTITFQGNNIIISTPYNQSDFTWSTFSGSNSMQPSSGRENKGIYVKPKTVSDLSIGNVVIYVRSDGQRVHHRIVNIGYDSDGWFSILKGDNNNCPDEKPVRFSQIESLQVVITQ